METLQFQVEIASSKELVWLAWTQTERIVQWFAPGAQIEARVGGSFELYFDPANRDQMSTKGCKITLLEPMDRLGFTWKGPDDLAQIMNKEGSLTTVLVTFAENNGFTKVVVEHAGWGEGGGWEKAIAWHRMAWNQVLGSLKSALESGTGELCCAPNK
ncbi:SRPBCC domain-containing protein [Paenibacillus sp. MSJ-34]|uniref:SRPBCC family protein n=1 Tax=Paenibacillus sp. MSJ-34 TaxID=2841529 RepID=UPI001C0F9A6E|nr:SRPBCC domain-containing protein [Paenibacillus sp. MSJ-34]MBU5444844.1 SRPBCC domain-containing protein [Paenibacillus sp. MSJ-34]